MVFPMTKYTLIANHKIRNYRRRKSKSFLGPRVLNVLGHIVHNDIHKHIYSFGLEMFNQICLGK